MDVSDVYGEFIWLTKLSKQEADKLARAKRPPPLEAR